MQDTQYATKRSILCRGAFCGPTVHAPLQHKGTFLYPIKPFFIQILHNKLFTQAEIRTIPELRVRLVPLNLLKFLFMYLFC